MHNHEVLITDVRLFPRSEYYTRFQGTTAFDMDDPSYWGSYHRSEASRFFHEAGGRKNTQFLSPCVKKALGTHSFYAHTGGYHSPFSIKKYSNAYKLEEQVSEGTVNIRDKLLIYKNRMAKYIVESFEEEHKQSEHQTRRIVYTENDYPCVLVELQVENEAMKYWRANPKPLQKMLLSCFIAFLNVEAMRANIPIEMVLRASFGHNTPSVCETGNTFRINVGVIPICYARLIGKALHQLNQAVGKITDRTSLPPGFDNNFFNQVRKYNAKKLKKAILEKDRYLDLRGSTDFNNAEESDESFERLYKAFCEKNKGKIRKGGANFTPVNLKSKTIWQVIRQAGDSMGRTVLDECFRQNGTEDWFANQVMDALLAGDLSPIETALNKLLKLIRYDDKVTMDYKIIHTDLKKVKRVFPDLSFKSIYDKDREFSEIVGLIFESLDAKKPDRCIYSALERAGANFFQTAKGSQNVPEDPDYGSDSEFEVELNDVSSRKKHHMAHTKLRVCAGMKAIAIAQYGALSYFRLHGRKEYALDAKQMYYEVEDALGLVNIKPPVLNNVRAVTGEENSAVLHYDMNHCNATNARDNQTLSQKLVGFKPAIVILDYTSSTASAIKTALQQCFSRQHVELVMLVESGLKNNQCGLDINPYGEVRICARNKGNGDSVLGMMREGLSEQDKLSPKAHEKVRACKRRGPGFSLFGLFKTNKSRFKAIVEDQILNLSHKL